MWFSCFPVLSGSAEAQVIWGGIVKRLLIAYFIGNISAEKYQYPFMCVKVLVSQRWDVSWDTVYILTSTVKCQVITYVSFWAAIIIDQIPVFGRKVAVGHATTSFSNVMQMCRPPVLRWCENQRMLSVFFLISLNTAMTIDLMAEFRD